MNLGTFHSVDLEVLAETIRILKLLTSNELIAVEQRNRADFCARYCEGLQLRVEHLVVTITKGGHEV